MNERIAQSYVRYHFESVEFSKKLCTKLLPFNIGAQFIAIALYSESLFVVASIAVIMANIITSVVFRKKWSLFIGFVSQGTQLLLFAIGVNFIIFGMYKCTELFVFYEYLIIIAIQVIVSCIGFYLIVTMSKRHNEKKKGKSSTVMAATTTIAVYAWTTAFCKLFLAGAPLSTVITILSVIMNVLICLLNYVAIGGYYRAFLVKKYRIEIEMK